MERGPATRMNRGPSLGYWSTFAVLAAVLLVAGCAQPVIEEAEPGDDLHLDLPILDSESWVERFNPERSAGDYNLMLYQRRIPLLTDMNGRIVHSWPLVRVTARARLGGDGRLLVIGIDNAVKIYDWEGRLVWRYTLAAEGDIPHHDVIWLENGNVLVLAQERSVKLDYLLEIDKSGAVVWEWRFADHLDTAFPHRDRRHPDPTHVNSVHEIGPNPWFDAGDQRFRPGNILLSARTLDAVLVVDRSSGEIVWTFDRFLDRQHEAVMVPMGRPGEGRILVFNNGLQNQFGYRRSSILAVDPVQPAIPWAYRGSFFYSSLAGSEQSLPNGNVLVTSSHGGRVFEVTADEEMVWQFIPPWDPMRVVRYPWDHCKQLRSLGAPQMREVPPQRKWPYISQELHTFAVSGEYRHQEIEGRSRQMVKDPNSCRQMVLPAAPALAVGYGIDLEAPAAESVSARFRISLERLDTGERVELVNDMVTADDAVVWHEPWIPVKGLDFRHVRLCLELETSGANGSAANHPAAVIENPRFYAGDQPIPPRKRTDPRLSDEERKLREEQLRAIGYIQ